MEIHPLRTRGLGDTSYLVTHGDRGALIDPQRDIARFLELIAETGTTVTHVLETHVHNDYLSGAPALARRLDADLVMPAAAGVAFAFVPAFHREDIEGADGLRIHPLHTPGHTPEHTSYLLVVDDEPIALFSGGSLLVGSAGRTDLLGGELAESLARLQYRSVQRLATLPDHVSVHPTHGEGSFCTVSAAGGSSSTIGQERSTNIVFHYPDEDSFVKGQLDVLLPFPSYYAHMAPLNRRGPDPLLPLEPPSLDERALSELIQEGAAVVDTRSRPDYASGHLSGSLNIPAEDSFATWVGWLVPFGTPVVLVLGAGQDVHRLATDLGRIGYDVAGVVTDVSGLEEVSTSRLATVPDLASAIEEGAQVIDVRDPAEWQSLHVDGVHHRYLPDLREGLPADAEGEVWLVCASGNRAGIAAGLVERAGGRPVVVDGGGIPELARLRPDLAAG